MNNEDSVPSSLNSTDTSQFLRALEGLNDSGAVGSYPGSGNSEYLGGSGDATLTQLMQTIYTSTPKQKIVMQGDGEQDSFSVYGHEVDIFIASTEESPRAGSNKVKITPVVKYAWEQQYYYGNLVAVHRNNDFVAFCLNGGKSGVGGNVRVLNRRSAERALLKGFMGMVLDVAFAHSDEVILACVDEYGNLFVHSCQSASDGKIITSPLLHVMRSDKSRANEYHRVIWCPYWPDDEVEEETEGCVQDSSKMLAVTQGEKIELWAVDLATRDYGAGPLNLNEVESGLIVVEGHTQPIVDAVFSPDGSALATASLDGEVKFFQVDWQNIHTSPRCLHQWQPHAGQPLSFLAFLDDLKHMSSDAQFWKFAVTGASKNQELKVWSCETWSCLQTIRFLPPPDLSQSATPALKASVDASSHYLVLSDKVHMVVYVLQIHQDNETGTAHFSSVSEFPLTQPCLSFAILEACTKKFKPSPNESHLDEITTGELQNDNDHSQNNSEENGHTTTGVQIRLYGVHTRALQELLIRFCPDSSVLAQNSLGSVSHDETSLHDGLSDFNMGVETSFADSEANDDVPLATRVATQSRPTLLLTPEAFTTSSKGISPVIATTANTTVDDVLSSTSSFTQVTGLTGNNAEDLLLSPDSSAAHSMVISASPHSPTSGAGPTMPSRSPHSILHTPIQTTRMIGGMSVSTEVTPTNIPLPPEEENELVTPKSSHHSSDSLIPSGIDLNSSAGGDSQVGDMLEAFFNPQPALSSTKPRPAHDVSSTGSFQVDHLLPKEMTTVGPNMRRSGDGLDVYDENDQEVAEVLGEDLDKSYPSSIASGAAASGTEDFPADDDRPHKPWPLPPNVSTDAKQLATDALQQSAKDECPEKLTDSVPEDEYSEDQNEEDEAEIEEEIEEADEDEDDVEERRVGEQRDYESQTRAGRRAPQVQIIREVIDRTMLEKLHDFISKLSMEVTNQQQQLRQLQQQLADQHELQIELQRQQLDQTLLRSAAQPMPDLEQQLGRVQNVVASRVERTLAQTLSREVKSLHDRLTTNESRTAAGQETLHHEVIQSLSAATHQSLETVVHNEFKQSVLPMMQKTVDQMREQLHIEMAQKLTATDSILKDNISKIVRSRQTVEAIGTAASSAIQGPLQSLLRDVFQSHVVPSFEHATQTMANQINTTFQTGTKEYISQLKTHLDQIRQEQNSARDPLLSQLAAHVDSFKQNMQHLQDQVVHTVRSEVSGQLKANLLSFQEQMSSTLRSMVREEVNSAMQEHSATMTERLSTYLRSGAGTPVPVAVTPDPSTVQTLQAQIRHFVNTRRFSDAFQLALTASNLELVVFVCELVDPSQVFSQNPCLLSQPVLLSLIQQLSAELHTASQIKTKYLTEAVTSLDPNDPVTREHIPTVLESLVLKLRTFLKKQPHNKELKLLLMAATSLLSR